jgi:outer membrane receptor for ferrienterochelin and colicins
LGTLQLKEDILGLEQVVVSATREHLDRCEAPVVVGVIDQRLFRLVQATNISEGLSFQPGLRLENNCQNCGFTQVRMNGLGGAYSQILIDGRPVFSALNGVYGLEQIPVNMLERIEVIRGGGSALYGGNAIAGTINIITKEPTENSFEVASNSALIGGSTLDNTLTFNANMVNEARDKGLSVFGLARDRDWYDANGDGFSEIVKLRN